MSNRAVMLAFNAGSSSLKFAAFELGAAGESLIPVASGSVAGIGRDRSTMSLHNATREIGAVADVAEALSMALDGLRDELRLGGGELFASAHRIVHGGERFSAPALLDTEALGALRSLVELAPLHNAASLAVIEGVAERFPDVPAVGVFDTAFFHDLPDAARHYAIPAEWAERYQVRRYGFHGLAHQHLSEQTLRAARDGPPPKRLLTLQLGQGCSITALRDGRPVETSMGFTPLEGLVMGTRAGDIDAGVLLHLARQGYDWKALDDALNRRSGLLGLSGASDDIRRLLELESRQHEGAQRALAVFHHRLSKYVGAYAAVLGGVDAIAFGGGIGENSPAVRARICERLDWLGLTLDAEANAQCIGRAGRISTDTSAIEAHVFPVAEEPIIAEAALALLSRNDRGDGSLRTRFHP